MIYELIGRLIVKIAWIQYGRRIRIAGGITAALLAGTVYLLSRKSPPEG